MLSRVLLGGVSLWVGAWTAVPPQERAGSLLRGSWCRWPGRSVSCADRKGPLSEGMRDRSRLSATAVGGCATGLGVMLGMFGDDSTPGDGLCWVGDLYSGMVWDFR